ncbi:hypothetical protein H6802_04505 [Candidatus Nomurabacteria bacterium]|uniref:HTH arsR-type domain-containing protein n=1 Tax=candidate division WWE3 bacterium TaxID=2053526 RepID=A0A955E131_UNCKA|nr:hypothetical protein [candidate division WWE3 bacterium]MCB9824181.1 hypothetical protein [Candidatus Nomurabacteria bacterium]MCB9826848.1 hypothetical protein [Candidatus Nomurabacteria bacterium]MCB9828122.1 hypothetical protein [Candidatus Nomurabacteria bacterium]HXK52434.1 hypothetical protein [bacterium]
MLKDLFVSEVRVKILALMLPNPAESLHVRAIVRAIDTEINAVRRELSNLYNIGLMKRRQSSNRIYYTVDTSHILYAELLSLVSKEYGLGADIIASRKKLGDIRFAILARRFSRNEPSTMLDIDLFIVGSINLEVLDAIVKNYEQSLGKEIHYSVMGAEEFLFRKRRNDQFISKVLSQGRTMLVGDEEELCSI